METALTSVTTGRTMAQIAAGKPGKAAKARRVDAKKGRSAIKAGRGKVSLD